MNRYGKGARSERELIEILAKEGYSVIRAAGSGVGGECPDVLAFKKGKQFAIECKAWNRNRIAIENKKYEELVRWQENTGIKTMIAWKIPYFEWLFIDIKDLEKNPASYSITKIKAKEIGKKINEI